ncbi:DUF2384 domain-containing protein [Ectothiorhodospiraceae bacterium 2226]|nr:DUF2384 domain-containing protein [Ectothiorhodospiraceae bacterium 2226]
MDAMSPQDRGHLATLIVTLLGNWGLSLNDQVRLLGMPAGTRARSMRRHFEGEPLPDDPGVNERIEHLVGIADALRTSYPQNPQMGPIWMNRANRHLNGRTPVAVMVEDDLQGILAVRKELDCAFGWSVDEARQDADAR